MTFGTGVFLSALLLGTVLLFIATKDRWNWKKIILWPLSIVLGLSVLGGLGFYIYSKIPYRPKVQETFWGISLETMKSDIRFLKGGPSFEGDGTWIYDSKKGELFPWAYHIDFEGDKVRSVWFYGGLLSAPGLQGVSIDATTSIVLERFGEPSYISTSVDELDKIFSYDKFHIFFGLAKNKVKSYGMYNPEFGPIRFEFEIEKQSENPTSDKG